VYSCSSYAGTNTVLF
nr:immunoglobulin light chain junction region [Macaca mulatta]